MTTKTTYQMIKDLEVKFKGFNPSTKLLFTRLWLGFKGGGMGMLNDKVIIEFHEGFKVSGSINQCVAKAHRHFIENGEDL